MIGTSEDACAIVGGTRQETRAIMGEAVRDSGTSVWFSKNFGLFIKDENVKRLMSSSMSKVAENIYNTPDKSVKDLKNESK